MNVRPTLSSLSVVGKNEKIIFRENNFQITPDKSANTCDKETVFYVGSVKSKTKFFENFVTSQKESLKKVNITSTDCDTNRDLFPLNPLFNEVYVNKVYGYTHVHEGELEFEIHDKENDSPENEEDGILPPPPDYYEDYNSEITSGVSDDRSIGIIISELSVLSDDLTEVSPFDQSFSMLEDIYEELRRKNYVGETSSLGKILTTSDTTKSSRRSLSWSDKIQYIAPPSPEKEIQITNDELEILDSNLPSSISSDSLRSESLESYDQCISRTKDDNIDINNTDETKAATKAKTCMERLSTLMRDPNLVIGGQEHTSACLNLVESCLKQQSIAERTKDIKNVPCAIDGYLEMQEIQLRVKEGFALIDCDNLEKCNLGPVLKKLKTLYHVVLLVRCRADSQIKASHVYNLVSESDARKLGLPHEPISWIQMYEYVKFSNLQPGFKLIFELYSMDASPNQQTVTSRMTIRTPLRHLMCRSTEGRRGADRVVFFSNIGSFSVTAHGLSSVSQREEVRFRVHTDCVFSGQVAFSTKFSMHLVEQCRGRLNVYSDVAGVGSWSYFDCELLSTSLYGRRSSSSDSMGGMPELDLGLHLCEEDAQLCNYTVCAKPNTFSVRLDAEACQPRTPCNRRVSTDGRHKRRFLAEADSWEQAAHWCRTFNLVRGAFVRWARDIILHSPLDLAPLA